MAVYVSLVPCAGSEDNARFFCSRQTAQISAEVREGDILSVRGYGKYLVGDITGQTKSGRIKLKLKKYI